MRAFWAILALVACLGLEVLLGNLYPGGLGWIDLMLLPVAWYGIRGEARLAMFVGSAAGLLQDAWFQAGILGFNGFKKTFLAWAVGTLGARFELNRRWIHPAVGALLAVADEWIGFGLLLLLQQRVPPPQGGPTALRALVSGLLVALIFVIFDRGRGEGAARRPRSRPAGRPFG